jgi:hypothetical protein
MHHLVKDCDFRDNPPNPHFRPGMSPYRELLTTYSADLPEVQEIVAMMRGVIEEDDDRRLVVVLNLGAKSQSFNLADLESDAIVLLSTRLDRTRENLGDTLELRGDEGVIIELA